MRILLFALIGLAGCGGATSYQVVGRVADAAKVSVDLSAGEQHVTLAPGQPTTGPQKLAEHTVTLQRGRQGDVTLECDTCADVKRVQVFAAGGSFVFDQRGGAAAGSSFPPLAGGRHHDKPKGMMTFARPYASKIDLRVATPWGNVSELSQKRTSGGELVSYREGGNETAPGVWAGQWTTNWGPLDLVQKGSRVTGKYTAGGVAGTIEGAAYDDHLSLQFADASGGLHGRAIFKLSSDEQSFDGSFGDDAHEEGGVRNGKSGWKGKRSDGTGHSGLERAEADCESRDALRCRELGDYQRRRGANDRALVLYDRSCSLGNAAGCYSAGQALSAAKDFVKAAVYYEAGCQKKSLYACHALADAYQQGQGVTADPTRADALYRKSCNDKSSPAARAELCVRPGVAVAPAPADATGVDKPAEDATSTPAE